MNYRANSTLSVVILAGGLLFAATGVSAAGTDYSTKGEQGQFAGVTSYDNVAKVTTSEKVPTLTTKGTQNLFTKA